MTSDQPGIPQWASPGTAPPQPPIDPPANPGGWANSAAPPPYQGWGSAVPQAPRPGVIPLRPLGVGELLDGAFTTIRRYPAATLLPSAVVMLFVEVVQVATSYWLLHGVQVNNTTLDGSTPNGDFLARLYASQGIVQIVTLVATVLLSGMLTVVAGQAVLGRPMSIGQAWERTRPLVWRLIGATLLLSLILGASVIAGAVPGAIIAAIGAAAGSTALVVLGIVLAALGGFVVVIYAAVSLLLATPALVLEKLTIRRALSRSFRLVRGSWWRVFGVILLAGIISAVIGGIITVPFELAGGSLSSAFSGHTEDQYRFTPLLLTGIGGLLAGIVLRPFTAGMTSLLYIDRRMRAEALDLTLAQAAANNAS